MADSHEPVQVSVVTPMHDEEACAGEFVRRVDIVLDVLGRTSEIVVVSDGSTDRTEPILLELSRQYPRLRCVFLARNVGQAAALYAGLQVSRGEQIVIMDGDLQNLPEEIPLLLAELDRGYDFVSGFRSGRPESWLSRRLPSMIANGLLRWVTGCAIRDMGGFKALRGEMARSLQLRSGHHRLLPALVHLHGGSLSEVTVSTAPRYGGKSHYGLSRTVDVLFDILMLGFQSSFRRRPLYLFGRIGLLLLAVDAVVIPWLLFEKFAFDKDMGTRPPFLIAIMFFLAALFMLIAGFILELLASTHDAAAGSRPYVVRAIAEGGVARRPSGRDGHAEQAAGARER